MTIIPELGTMALLLALALALVQGIVPIAGAARGAGHWMSVATPAARGQFTFVVIAFSCLVYGFVSNDFSVRYVAENSNSALPLYYRIAAVWGGHEGSILLWVLMLSSWTFAVTLFSRHLPEQMRARVIGVMGLISVGFLSFTLFTSNPFERLLPPAMDGRDLNPLLQDPGMIFHPPMLYMGYVGFSVAFAFAVSALLDGKLDAAWARWSRPWTTVAWIFLTLGIALGSGWAYYVLGWGGWWFWDPVENASFLPWLVGTALMHSLAVTEKRGTFKTWTVLLAISGFSLSLMGTFLVRSGVLSSVHGFATDPRRGIFILALLGVVCGGSLILFMWRAPRVGIGGRFALLSRETLLLANNVLLSAAAITVLLGTVYPLLLDALDLGKISVGPPYFEAVFTPILAAALVLMGVGPLMRWKQGSLVGLRKTLALAGAISLAPALILPLLLGRSSLLISVGLFIATWIIALTLVDVRDKIAHIPEDDGALGPRLTRLSRSYYGMALAHIGVATFVIGVTLVKGYETEKDVRMGVGDTVTMGGYTFTFKGVSKVPGPNYVAGRGVIEVSKGGNPVTTLQPEKRLYAASGMPITNAAIDIGLLRDLYVALGEPLGDGAWSVRVYHKPFIDWIWGGCVLMALGGLLAVSDLRYRPEAQRPRARILDDSQVRELFPQPAVASAKLV